MQLRREIELDQHTAGTQSLPEVAKKALGKGLAATPRRPQFNTLLGKKLVVRSGAEIVQGFDHDAVLVLPLRAGARHP
jgi:hypothetical protein